MMLINCMKFIYINTKILSTFKKRNKFKCNIIKDSSNKCIKRVKQKDNFVIVGHLGLYMGFVFDTIDNIISKTAL